MPKDLVHPGESPCSHSTLEIKIDERRFPSVFVFLHSTLRFGHVLLRQNGHAHRVHYDYRVGVPVVTLQSKNCCRYALQASEQGQHAVDVIDAMLFKRGWEMQAAFNRHTPHLLKVSFVRWRYALSRNPPASIGYGGFSR